MKLSPQAWLLPMKLSIKPDPVNLPLVGRAMRAFEPKARIARPTAAKIMFGLALLILLFSMNMSYADEPTKLPSKNPTVALYAACLSTNTRNG